MTPIDTPTAPTTHPLAPLLNAAIGLDPASLPTYVDTVPLSETVAVLILGTDVPSIFELDPLYLYPEHVIHPDSEGPATHLHYHIPSALAVVLFKLQQVIQGVDNGESWQDVLDHLCKPRVWGEDVARELPPANRLALVAPAFFRAGEKSRAGDDAQLNLPLQ
jgi:hypothetical protein